MSDIPIVVPSHKRAHDVKTLKLLPQAIVCVPESQYADYKANYPDFEFDVHSDELKGISPKRNYILQKYKNVVMIDDDLVAVKRCYLEKETNIDVNLNPIEFYGLIQDTYHIAKDMGVNLFGFPLEGRPEHFAGNKPISLGSFIAGGFQGLIWNEHLHYPDMEYITGEDDFMTLLNAYYTRFVYCDKRFSLHFHKTGEGEGGCIELREAEKKKQSFHFLKSQFGDSVKSTGTCEVSYWLNK